MGALSSCHAMSNGEAFILHGSCQCPSDPAAVDQGIWEEKSRMRRCMLDGLVIQWFEKPMLGEEMGVDCLR